MAVSTSKKLSGLDCFENVVVLMLENRSFDNLLGTLYPKGAPDNKKFEGLQNYKKEMPVPPRAVDFKKHNSVPLQFAKDYHQPFPDPGEVYQHVNTQLYNFVNKKNINTPEEDMKKPYNIPKQLPPEEKQMLGFVNDYINNLQAIRKKKYPQYNKATYDLYKVIMQVYSAKQVNVLSKLAQNFAVFDHWFCAVPSQTWCNRAFWHAATSGGQVINPGEDKGIIGNAGGMIEWAARVWTRKTLFELMEKAKITHGIYTQNPVSLTTIVNGPFKDENVTHDDLNLTKFKSDLDGGTLPQYSFIEPKFIGQHNDMHPSSLSGLIDGPTRNGSVLLGEHLIWDLYTSIFNNRKYKNKTLFIITSDEHGGTFDHVVPGKTVPPKPNMKGQKGFNFKRLGIRVPMVMVSAYIQPNTIENGIYSHTSFMRTLGKKWPLPTLTDRDKNANTFEHLFTGPPRTFPPIDEPYIPKTDPNAYDNDELNSLQKSILIGASFLAKHYSKDAIAEVDTTSLSNAKTVKDALEALEGMKYWLKQAD